MSEVEISFGEGRDGVVPVGTFLGDAARRMGVGISGCDQGDHKCGFAITKGNELLSPVSAAENEQSAGIERTGCIRLGCFAQIIKPGEIVAMAKKETKSTNEPETAGDRDEDYRKKFSELPLEKKIANLVQLEAMTLSETLTYVINSPFTVFDKIGDVLAEFGFRKEDEEKRRSRPTADTSEDKGTQTKRSARKQPDASA